MVSARLRLSEPAGGGACVPGCAGPQRGGAWRTGGGGSSTFLLSPKTWGCAVRHSPSLCASRCQTVLGTAPPRTVPNTRATERMALCGAVPPLRVGSPSGFAKGRMGSAKAGGAALG